MPRPAKGARLYYRKSHERWFVRDSGGVDFSTGCRHGEREAAERALQEYLARKHKPDFGQGDPARILIADVLSLYADERAAETKRPDVVWSALPHLIDFFDGRMVAHATPNLCAGYVRWRRAMPQKRFKDPETAPRVGTQTARRELEVLAAAFGYAHKEHKLLYPVAVTLPDKAPARDRWLTRSEAARLLWAALGFRRVGTHPITGREIWRRTGEAQGKTRHVARFILLGLYTGTRHDAILRLKWLPSPIAGWVDLRAGILYRRGTGEGESTKRRTPIPLSRRLLAHLTRWRSQSVAHVVEFEGLPIAKMRRGWRTAREAAGLGPEVTPHILRHTFATWAVQGGAPFGLVAGALGTTEAIVANVYGHHAPEHLRGVVETVSGRRRS
ncbi:site-specific integrase [Methylobacterium nodulans]|uniref:Integrase family protein n=1 Tax=Methylobacterium nodulans (strain LMG 21967 / CNCM I-2342 / ORS 2060) TaxID=460265 RepID=B8IUU4_METNO|nr:site-specific integrase [Methylobacterium nodulans]ACL59002.1 integrase family protein [Methylobacterium nodulans ORS 2060]